MLHVERASDQDYNITNSNCCQ